MALRSVITYGDSITDAIAPLTDNYAIPNVLAQILRERSGQPVGGDGYCPAYTGSEVATTGTPTDVGQGIGLKAKRLNAGGDSVTLSVAGTTARLFYHGQAVGAQVQITFPGYEPTFLLHTTTAQLGGGTQYSLYRDYSIPTGATTMKVEWYAALGGGPTICGVQSFNGDESRGWEVFNGGHTGYIYENFSNQVTQVSAEAARIDPNYIFWYLGTNEQTLAQDPVADMEPDIRLVVEAVLAAAPNCRQVLVAPWTRVNDLSWTYPMASYVRSLEKLANYYELGFINLSDPAVHPQPGSEAAILGNYYNDTVHPSINGAAAVAELYANEILGTPYAPETSANIQNLKHDFFSTSGAVDNDALDVLSGEASLGLIVGSKIGLI